MSELLDRNLSRKVSEVMLTDLKILVAGFLDEANKVMGHAADITDMSWLNSWTCSYLGDRYGYMPIHHVRAAISYGALGERGGTSKLIPRNIAIWIRMQSEILQEMLQRQIKSEDEKQRNDHFNATKAEWQVAAAVRIKVGWLGDKLITSEEYDSFSSKDIYDLLKQGIPEGRISPRLVVPNYDNHRHEN